MEDIDSVTKCFTLPPPRRHRAFSPLPHPAPVSMLRPQELEQTAQ